jgi:hypothetical protein
VRVRRYGEDVLLCWCEFNASVLTREGRQRDEALTKDKTEVAAHLSSIGRKCDMVW